MLKKSVWLCLVFYLILQIAHCDENEDNDAKGDKKQEWCHNDNCYEILGLEQSVDHRTIKSRYNNLSLFYHPDKNPNQTEADRDKYVKINRAYEILSDSTLRRDYDQYLRVRTSMDSPKEHPIFVFSILYALLVVIVLQYQKQHYRNVRKSVLDNLSVQQYFEQYYDIDLKGNKKPNKRSKTKGKSRKEEKKYSE